MPEQKYTPTVEEVAAADHELNEVEREKARAWETFVQHPVFADCGEFAHIQVLAMWRKLDSLVDVPAPEAREVSEAEIEAAAKVLYDRYTENTVAGWDDIDDEQQEYYRTSARLTLVAVRVVFRG